MGGMGTMVTSLAAAQAKRLTSRKLISVVFPYYRFLRDHPKMTGVVKHETLVVPIQACFLGWLSYLPCLLPGLWINVHVDVHTRMDEELQVRQYLIGPGDYAPFHLAFDADEPRSIYSSRYGLRQEWQDLLFNKAVGIFLSNASKRPGSRMVHIHGATNGMSISFFHENPSTWSSHTSFIYSLHDYGDEPLYSLRMENIQGFSSNFSVPCAMDRIRRDSHLFKGYHVDHPAAGHYCFEDRLFVSGMAIAQSNFATFVSHSVASEMIQGTISFRFKEFILPALLGTSHMCRHLSVLELIIVEKAKTCRFHGITNGVELGRLNPFSHAQLVERRLHFPISPIAYLKVFGAKQSELPPSQVSTLSDIKSRIKRLLHDEFGLFRGDTYMRPLLLYIGRFQYQKGVGDLLNALPTLQALNVNVVLMGQPHNVDERLLTRATRQYPFLTILGSLSEQDQFGIYIRAAADISLVPSWMESFGLVAAEALAFGSVIVTTGVGGLKEFLIDRASTTTNLTSAKEQFESSDWNSYQFRVGDVNGLVHSIQRAVEDLQMLTRSNRIESFQWHLIQQALNLGWDGAAPLIAKENGLTWDAEKKRKTLGPVDWYLKIYQRVSVENHDGRHPR